MPCDLNFLMGPRKNIGFQFVLLPSYLKDESDPSKFLGVEPPTPFLSLFLSMSHLLSTIIFFFVKAR